MNVLSKVYEEEEWFFMDERKQMGKAKKGVIFPVAPNSSEMSNEYLEFIDKIKKEIKS